MSTYHVLVFQVAATIKYFKMIAAPRDGYPGFFDLATRHHLYWSPGKYSKKDFCEPYYIRATINIKFD